MIPAQRALKPPIQVAAAAPEGMLGTAPPSWWEATSPSHGGAPTVRHAREAAATGAASLWPLPGSRRRHLVISMVGADEVHVPRPARPHEPVAFQSESPPLQVGPAEPVVLDPGMLLVSKEDHVAPEREPAKPRKGQFAPAGGQGLPLPIEEVSAQRRATPRRVACGRRLLPRGWSHERELPLVSDGDGVPGGRRPLVGPRFSPCPRPAFPGDRPSWCLRRRALRRRASAVGLHCRIATHLLRRGRALAAGVLVFAGAGGPRQLRQRQGQGLPLLAPPAHARVAEDLDAHQAGAILRQVDDGHTAVQAPSCSVGQRQQPGGVLEFVAASTRRWVGQKEIIHHLLDTIL
mmetsp:Transcript_99842/g.282572  ORF Transcript_99842/g.282572 Transcript_99842/m.282572 type:complete len:348 (-) Transcript_99842:617-1660(-)